MRLKNGLFFILLLLASGLVAQNYVSTEPMNKNAILEGFTGVRCTDCPVGNHLMDSILDANPGRAFCVNYHPSNSGFTFPYEGDLNLRRTFPNVFYTIPYCGSSRFMPSTLINRRVYDGERLQEPENWVNHCNNILTEPSPANMGIYTMYEFFEHTLYIIVEIYFTEDMIDTNHINVLLSQNNIITQQAGASGPYSHQHTFRGDLLGQWGDVITEPTTQGSLITLNYEWNSGGSGYIVHSCEVLAFIEDQSTGEIITGIGVEVGDQTYPIPTAGFSVDDQTVAVGDQAIFTDESLGSPTEWHWTFEGGDPATSDEQFPPPITYDYPGQYTVTLEVINPADTNTLTLDDFVDVDYPPAADFEANNTMILEGESIMFTDLSTGNPDSWAWYFEEGTPDSFNGQSPPEILYGTHGIYSVSLTVINDYGENILLESGYIHVGGLGIYEETNKKAFSIYPNPSRGILHIEAKNADKIDGIIIRNVNGQEILFSQPPQGMLHKLDLSGIEAGLYIIEIKTREAKYLEKVILK